MSDPFLMGIHVFFADLAMLGYLWVFVDLLNPISDEKIARARNIALFSLIFIILTWVTAGYYYVVYYPADRAVIKASSVWDWGHKIIMETKEHVFFFAPVLAFVVYFVLYALGAELKNNDDARKAVQILAVVMIIGNLLLISMGSLIAFSYRGALEGLVGYLL